MESEICLFEYGAEGGGANVYLLPNGSVVERGSSGGIDEDEDIRKWERPYESWEAWWNYFVSAHKEHWIHMSPVFIHISVKPFIQSAVDNYGFNLPDVEHCKDRWIWRLSEYNS